MNVSTKNQLVLMKKKKHTIAISNVYASISTIDTMQPSKIEREKIFCISDDCDKHNRHDFSGSIMSVRLPSNTSIISTVEFCTNSNKFFFSIAI